MIRSAMFKLTSGKAWMAAMLALFLTLTLTSLVQADMPDFRNVTCNIIGDPYHVRLSAENQGLIPDLSEQQKEHPERDPYDIKMVHLYLEDNSSANVGELFCIQPLLWSMTGRQAYDVTTLSQIFQQRYHMADPAGTAAAVERAIFFGYSSVPKSLRNDLYYTSTQVDVWQMMGFEVYPQVQSNPDWFKPYIEASRQRAAGWGQAPSFAASPVLLPEAGRSVEVVDENHAIDAALGAMGWEPETEYPLSEHLTAVWHWPNRLTLTADEQFSGPRNVVLNGQEYVPSYVLSPTSDSTLQYCALAEVSLPRADLSFTVQMETPPAGTLRVQKKAPRIARWEETALPELGKKLFTPVLESAPLANTRYALYTDTDLQWPDGRTSQAGAPVAELNTDADGLACLENMPLGSYTLREIDAPLPYLLEDQPIPLKVVAEDRSSAAAAAGSTEQAVPEGGRDPAREAQALSALQNLTTLSDQRAELELQVYKVFKNAASQRLQWEGDNTDGIAERADRLGELSATERKELGVQTPAGPDAAALSQSYFALLCSEELASAETALPAGSMVSIAQPQLVSKVPEAYRELVEEGDVLVSMSFTVPAPAHYQLVELQAPQGFQPMEPLSLDLRNWERDTADTAGKIRQVLSELLVNERTPLHLTAAQPLPQQPEKPKQPQVIPVETEVVPPAKPVDVHVSPQVNVEVRQDPQIDQTQKQQAPTPVVIPSSAPVLPASVQVAQLPRTGEEARDPFMLLSLLSLLGAALFLRGRLKF